MGSARRRLRALPPRPRSGGPDLGRRSRKRLGRYRMRPPRRRRHRYRKRPRELHPHPTQHQTPRGFRTANRRRSPPGPSRSPQTRRRLRRRDGREFRGHRQALCRSCAPLRRARACGSREGRTGRADIRGLWSEGRDHVSAGLAHERCRGAAPPRRREQRLYRLGGEIMIGLIAATANGRRNAAHLADVWPDAHHYDGKARDALGLAWNECDGIVLFLATGAAVRLIAPLLRSKHRDPGVVTVDDAADFAVALCGGHEGGANDLAVSVADTLGATPVLTTASDSLGIPALDSLGRSLGFHLEEGSDHTAVGAALVSGGKGRLLSERRWPIGPLPENIVRTEESEAPVILISDRLEEVRRPSVIYRPPSLVAGVGCSRGAGADEIIGLLEASLQEAGL